MLLNSFQGVIVFNLKSRLFCFLCLRMKINEREDSRQHIWKPPTAVFSADNCVRGGLQCPLPAHAGPGQPKAVSISSSESHHPQPTGHYGGHRAQAYGCSGNGLASSAADLIRGSICRNLHGMKCWCHFRCVKEEAGGKR